MSTRRFYLVGFVALMLFDTLTQVFFKLATRHAGAFAPDQAWLIGVIHNGWIVGAMLGYLLAFITWMTLLKHAPVGPAFAASHSEVITILAVSVIFFHEHLTWIQVLGGMCIVLGIGCLSFGQPAPRNSEAESN